jgi:tetratricopeptide (TPR) repeat protein
MTDSKKDHENRSVILGVKMPKLRRTIKGIFKEIESLGIVEAESEYTILEALKNNIQNKKFFLVIDWDQPEGMGLNITREIRGNKKIENTPILVLTSESTEKHVGLASEVGVSGYLVKPFTPKALLEKFHNIIELRENPPEHVKLILEGERLSDVGEYDEALAVYKRSRELVDSARIIVLLGEMLIHLGKTDEALKAFDEAIERNPTYLKAFVAAINLLIKEGRESEAIPYLEKAVFISPDNAERQAQLGSLYLSQGDKKSASTAFEAAIKLDKNTSYEIGKGFLDMGELQKAEDAFRAYLKTDNDHLDTYNKLALSLKRMGNWQKAVEEYKIALTKYPNEEVLYYNMGKAFVEGGNRFEARECYDRATQINPHFKEAHEELRKLGAGHYY